MSTRSNIIIVYKNKVAQVYHHHDSYIPGLGYKLSKLLNQFDDLGKSFDYDPWNLAEWLHSQDDEFVAEHDSFNPHGDIDFMYIINLEFNTIQVKRLYWGGYTVKSNTPWEDYEIVNPNDMLTCHSDLCISRLNELKNKDKDIDLFINDHRQFEKNKVREMLMWYGNNEIDEIVNKLKDDLNNNALG